MLQVWQEGWTALNSKGKWVTLREASEREITLSEQRGGTQFWLPASGEAYYALGARCLSDRLARIVEESEPLPDITAEGAVTVGLISDGQHGRYLSVETDEGVVHISTGLADTRTGQPVVVVEIVPNTYGPHRKPPEGEWGAEIHHSDLHQRITVRLLKDKEASDG